MRLDRQPEFLPDKYEPGSHNAVGLIGLSAGVQWVAEQTIEKLAGHDRQLLATFLEGLDYIEGLTYYGPRGVKDRIGLFSITLDGFDPHELSSVLESSFGILTRSGIHCAPWPTPPSAPSPRRHHPLQLRSLPRAFPTCSSPPTR